MSLYGALFGGVSGLKSQSSKIGVISDNIANVNTVGYKQSQALFETLVINSTTTVSYQTGGVRGGSRMNVDKQGLLLSTDAPTDIALSGGGFFVVNSEINGSGQPLYTRAGSFRQDSLGNFYNAQGFFLQGWPLDREGRLPGEVGNLNTTSFANLDSLETVNVESASGIAQSTTQIELGANLDAGENVYPGKSLTTTMDRNNAVNLGIPGDSIILSSEYSLAAANSLVRGDRFEVVTGNGLNYEYEYGGYTTGRNINTAGVGANFGDAGLNNSRQLSGAGGLQATQFVSDGAATYTVTQANHGLVTGDQISITNTGNAAELPDGTYTVTSLSNDTFSFTIAPPPGAMPGAGLNPAGATIAAGTIMNFNPYDSTGVIFDANSANEAFFGTTGVSRFTTAAMSFTISTSTDTHTFTYTASSPNALAGQFNNLTTLAAAIDEVVGLSARVAGGRLVISAEDASESLTFANGAWPTTAFDPAQTGIDWITELDISNVATGARRFNSLQGLADLVNSDAGVSAVIENPLSAATLQILVDDPLDTITFQDLADSTTFNIPGDTVAPNLATYEVTGAAAAGVDIPIRLQLPFDPATLGVTIGDQIVITGEQAAGLGLPGIFPNTPGAAHAAGLHLTVTAVNGVPNAIDFIIPGAYNTAGVAAVGPVDASGHGILSIVGESNQGSLIAELFADTTDSVADPNISSLNGAPYVTQDLDPPAMDVPGFVAGSTAAANSGVLGPVYDSSGVVGDNMASGDIVAQFSRNVRVYDALGAGHDLRYSFIKIAQNEWAVELHAIPATSISSALPNGQVAVGTIRFNGDGSLRSVSSSLTLPIEIVWTNGAQPSEVSINWGTAGQPFGTPGATLIGDTNGLSQFDADYNVAFINQNGAPVGELISVTIDEDGFVIASYSNGETQNLYKLPIAEFTNPNGLRSISGNVFAETRESGVVNLREAGTSGVGDVVSAALEQSNVELSEQLTDMIVAQRAYQSNTRVVSVTDELLEQLNNL